MPVGCITYVYLFTLLPSWLSDTTGVTRNYFFKFSLSSISILGEYARPSQFLQNIHVCIFIVVGRGIINGDLFSFFPLYY